MPHTKEQTSAPQILKDEDNNEKPQDDKSNPQSSGLRRSISQSVTEEMEQMEVEPRRGRRRYGYLFFYGFFGVRHLFICTLMMITALAGGYLFFLTEAPAEIAAMEAGVAAVEAKLDVIAKEIVQNAKTNSTTFNDEAGIQRFLTDAYVEMLKAEDPLLFKGSAFYKAQGPEYMTWRYWPAVFYTSNIYMTVGYGAIQGYTWVTKLMTILFGFISIPFSFVVIRDVAQWILVGLTRIYAKILIKWRKDHGNVTEEDEDISLPYSITLVVWTINWLIVSWCTWMWDGYSEPIGTGISFYGSMYFTYITLTSIGMSDEMPRNKTTSPMLPVWNVLGLPIYKMGCRILYIAIENGILGTLAVLKHKLARMDGVTDLDTAAIENYVPQKSATNKSLAGSMVDQDEKEQINEFVNNFTVGSIATFMKSHADAYAGEYGRVRVTRGELEGKNDDPYKD